MYPLDDARDGSAEYRMIERQSIGMRNGELGQLIIEAYEMSALVALPIGRHNPMALATLTSLAGWRR